MNKLITFGDSWAQGSELKEGELCYGELLANRFNLEFNNYAHPGSSISHLIVQLNDFIQSQQSRGVELNNTVALFFITGKERAMHYSEGGWTFQTPSGGFGNRQHLTTHLEVLSNQYFRYFHSDETAEFNANTSILCVQQLCRYHNIKDFYLLGWQKINLWQEIDKTKFLSNGEVTCAELLQLKDPIGALENKDNIYIKPNYSHPNKIGHYRIADFLEPLIKSCVIKEN